MSSPDGRAVATSSHGASRLTTWHQDLFNAVERWPWLHALNDSVSAVTQPLYDRYRGNLAVELMHGGRWAGHSVHAALSDLPIGLWSGSIVLDVLGKDDPPGRQSAGAGGDAERGRVWRPRSPPRPPGSPTGPSATARTGGSGCSTGC